MRLINQFIRRVLGRFGFAIVRATTLKRLEESRYTAMIAENAGLMNAIRQELATMSKEIAETKGGVSALQGESGEALSHIIVLRHEMAAASEQIAGTKGGVSALQGESGQVLSHVIVMRQELTGEFLQTKTATNGHGAAANGGNGEIPAHVVSKFRGNQSARPAAMLPRDLDSLALHLEGTTGANTDVDRERHMLVQHYARMAELVSRHWLQDGQLPEDPFPDDDLTFERAKRADAFVPGTDVEVATKGPTLPWRPLWFDRDCAIFLVLGNQTAGNHGETGHASAREVYNFDFLRMRCDKAADPLAGASGTGGSIWSRLGDRLIEKGLTRKVLFVPLAFAGSAITDWIPGGSRHRRTALALSRLHKELATPMLPFSAVLWQPGVMEDMAARAYRLHCHDVVADLRANGVFAPVFLAAASESKTAAKRDAGAPATDPADVVDPAVGIFAGPNLDASISADLRVHGRNRYSAAGLDRAAELWLDVLSARWPLLERPGAGGDKR